MLTMKATHLLLCLISCTSISVLAGKPKDISSDLERIIQGSNTPSLAAAAVLDAFKGVNEWYYATFSSISSRTN